MLFTLYRADPASVSGYADTLVSKATDVNNVNASVLEGQAKAAESVDGEITDLLDEPFDKVGKDSKKISLAAAFVAGELYDWSGAITTFNNGVKALNTEYETKKGNNFGVPDAPAGPSGGYSPGELESRHDKAVTAADSALKQELQRAWEKLDGALDAKAGEVNGNLLVGPSEDRVLALFASGDLPPTAFPLLSALGIDPKKVTSVLSDLRTFLKESRDGHVSSKRLEAWFNALETLKQLDPKAAAVILGALSQDELKALGAEITQDSGQMANASDFYGFILTGATADQVDNLKKIWKLNPEGKDTWVSPTGPLFKPPYVKPGENGGTFIGASQHGVDDCWMLARLNAIVGADPNWPQEHVRDNGNGTVSVKFYGDDGPYWVTVTDEVSPDAAQAEGPNASNWAIYYEKAMAADDHGRGNGYDGLGGGFNQTLDTYMTGEDVDTKSWGHFGNGYDAAVEAYRDHKGVVASNAFNAIGYGGDDALQTKHVYYVKDILPNGNVVLGNPWGDHEVTLTPEAFNVAFEDVSVVEQ